MWLLVIKCVVYLFIAITNAQQMNEAVFRKEKGKYVARNVIKTLQVSSEFDCSASCAGHRDCVSVNYKTSGENRGKCELTNGVGASLIQKNDVDKSEFNNLEIVHRTCEKPYEFSKQTKTCNVAFTSCKDLLAHNQSLQSGAYDLQQDITAQPYSVYCRMTEISGCGAGGWTLAMKMNGSKNTFGYNSSYWEDTTSYNIAAGLEGLTADKETKLESFWKTPFTKICLGMKVGDHEARWVTLQKEATSLLSLFSGNTFRATNLSKVTWKSLLPEPSMQSYCNKQGFNIHLYHTAFIQANIRLGIVANNENDCTTCDSFIGFGAHFYGCTVVCPITCGNYASCGFNDNGYKTTAVFGYILVQ